MQNQSIDNHLGFETHMNPNPPEVATFRSMRIGVGILAFALPITMILSSFIFHEQKRLLNSISAYYNSPVRDIYVGIVCMIAFFLFSYKGYDKHDNWSCNIAGILAFGFAFFPTIDNRNLQESNWINIIDPLTVDWIHTICAAIFFCILAYISIFLFTHTHKGAQIVGIKKGKNITFISTGIIIMVALICLLIINITNILSLRGTPVTMVLEKAMLVAFGTSWLVKGVI